MVKKHEETNNLFQRSYLHIQWIHIGFQNKPTALTSASAGLDLSKIRISRTYFRGPAGPKILQNG